MDRERLRFALRWAGLSQNQAAKTAGVLPQRITDDLAGRRCLPAAQVRSLARVLGVEPAWLAPPADRPIAPAEEPQHPVARLMRPVHARLLLATWGEALVVWRALQARVAVGDLDGEIARLLLQRMCGQFGLDERALDAAAALLEKLARSG